MFDKKLFQHVNAQSGEGGTNDYKQLINKPQVNGVTLNGNKTAEDLNLLSKDTEQEVTGNKNFTGTLQYKGEEVATASALATLETTVGTKADKTELPVKATNETLGGIKVGNYLNITNEGILSAAVDKELSAESNNPIAASAVYNALNNLIVLDEEVF